MGRCRTENTLGVKRFKLWVRHGLASNGQEKWEFLAGWGQQKVGVGEPSVWLRVSEVTTFT